MLIITDYTNQHVYEGNQMKKLCFAVAVSEISVELLNGSILNFPRRDYSVFLAEINRISWEYRHLLSAAKITKTTLGQLNDVNFCRLATKCLAGSSRTTESNSTADRENEMLKPTMNAMMAFVGNRSAWPLVEMPPQGEKPLFTGSAISFGQKLFLSDTLSH